MPAAYGDDLAHIHDVGHDWFARRSARGLLEILKRRRLPGLLVVDLGCGSGVWARELVDAGYDVVGVDLSTAMIRIASDRVPEARFHLTSMMDFEFPTCSAVTALGEVLAYEFDGTRAVSAMRRIFRRIYRTLEPGGVFIFDLPEPGRGNAYKCGFAEGDDWACLVKTNEDTQRRRLTREIVTFRREGAVYRRGGETHRLRLYRGSEIADLLRDVGFRARIVRRFGEFQFPPHWVGFVATKPHT